MNEGSTIDLTRLLKLRLVVGRYGEMDLAGWWNTNGMLGRHGAIALERGFRATHYFAQARVVFAVARSRCQELFDPPDSMTLWALPAAIEDRFEEQWQTWLSQSEEWTPFFEALQNLDGNDLLEAMSQLDLITPAQRDAASELRKTAETRAVQVPGDHRPDDETVTMLAAGFASGEGSAPVIPHARLAA